MLHIIELFVQGGAAVSVIDLVNVGVSAGSGAVVATIVYYVVLPKLKSLERAHEKEHDLRDEQYKEIMDKIADNRRDIDINTARDEMQRNPGNPNTKS